ncbi:zwei Ig domain protein zig-8-like isoform X2 [Hetaerina americana]|uniref:zwei Ig domain protein zig-8-like isoform X2 n=1 Tax=Hetaerina americana TaxID=62018 RepID=UPI003A7F1859
MDARSGPPRLLSLVLLLLCLLSFLALPLPPVFCSDSDAIALKTSDPFDAFPKNYWFEFTSPFTEAYEDESGVVGRGRGMGRLEDEDEEVVEESTTPEPLPFFEDFANATNITTQLGNTVFLHCKVNDLRDKTVSWVRRKGDNIHLLTFGLHTYSSDSRYSLNYQHPNDWKLQIKFANQRDQGHYECQVSSHPPRIFYVLLTVVVPKVEIVDERGVAIVDKFYKAGSTIELKCVISQVPHPSSYVTWKHGQRMLNYDTSRGGISVKTDILTGGAMSRLYIANANKQDSGNYTCALADVAETTVYVHVLNGENPAAMQHGCGTQIGLGGRHTLLALITLLTHLILGTHAPQRATASTAVSR